MHKRQSRMPWIPRWIPFLATLLAAMLFGGVVGLGSSSSTVTTSVTPEVISISASPSSYSYGYVGLGQQATSGTFVVENNGSMTVDIDISGQDAVGEGAHTWTLVTTTPGGDEYNHAFQPAGSTTWTPLTTSLQDYVNALAAGATSSFTLRITMPLSSTNLSQHQANVNLMATAASS